MSLMLKYSESPSLVGYMATDLKWTQIVFEELNLVTSTKIAD